MYSRKDEVGGVELDEAGAAYRQTVTEGLHRKIQNHSLVQLLRRSRGELTCDGCKWNGKRHQKCSCCRRNRNMKDNYKEENHG